MNATTSSVVSAPKGLWRSGWGIVSLIALALLAVEIADAKQYGIFRDEMYYLACGHHLAWGYVDQPPLIALLARGVLLLLGDSLYAIRLLPALAAAALVLLTGALAREMGGGRFAQGVAALCVAVAPGFLLFFHLFTMNAFEPLLWMGGAILVLRILKTRDGRLWLWFGVLAGIGMLNKSTELFFGFAVFVALLLTRERWHFAERWIWLGGLLALLIWSPNLIWQWRHGWPQLQVLEVTRAHRDIHLSVAQFFGAQALNMNPATLPVWLGGLWFLFFHRCGRAWRVLGWTYAVMFVTFVALRGKFYYLLPIYPMLFASGAVWIEGKLSQPVARWLKPSYAMLLVASGILLAPLALPVLPPRNFLRYEGSLGLYETKMEKGANKQQLPQIFADMFGWENMARQVAAAYDSLPPEERVKAAIYTRSWGEASAIDFFGPRYGLPPAICDQNSFWLWGPRNYTGEVMIIFGNDEDEQQLRQHFGQVVRVGTIVSEYARADETGVPIWICRQPNFSLQKVWPELRHYN